MVWTGVLGCWKEPIASLETVPRFQSLGTVVDQITTNFADCKNQNVIHGGYMD
jgi:hypothetical protein